MVPATKLTDVFARRTTANPRGTNSAEIPYIIRGATREAEVISAARSSIPASGDVLPRKNLEITERINGDSGPLMLRLQLMKCKPGEEPEPVFWG